MTDSRLQSIHIYPIKSCAPVQLSAACIESHGLPFDRRLMLSTPDGSMLSARQTPELLRFQALLLEDGIEIIAPDGEHLTLRYPELIATYRQVEIWGTEVNAQHCGEHYDEWFSEKLGRPCQLLYFGDQSERFTSRRPDKAVAFADGYPLLLISRASLDDLNSRSRHPVGMAHFRPNLVVSGTEAFAEDNWRRIRIGEVEFEIVKPCSRCVMTTFDPATSQPVPSGEPLRTLLAYRKGEDGEVYFGQNLVALNRGYIRQGDPLTVLETQESETYPDHAPVLRLIRSEQSVPRHWPAEKNLPLICTARVQETPDVVTFRLQPPAGYQGCNYQAGQFITLHPQIGEATLNRCYTLSSSPSRPADIAITVKQVKPGGVSEWLHNNLQPGQTINASGPQGHFHVHSSGQEKLLLLSAGSGITPLLSIVRYLTDTGSERDLVFYHQARTEQDLICRDELLWLQRQNPRLKLIFSLSRPASDWQGPHGHLNRQQLIDAVPDLTERAVYCCGPQGFMQQARDICRQLGLAEQNWLQESFSQPPLESAEPTDLRPVSLRFNQGIGVTGNRQEPLLVQAENHGEKIAYSCRAGICGTCRVRLISGEVERLSEAPLSEEEKTAGIILACSCIPCSDLEIEY